MKNKITRLLRELESNEEKSVKKIISIALEYQRLGQYSDALFYFHRALNIELSRDNNEDAVFKDLQIPNILYAMEVLQQKLGLFESSLELAHMRMESYGNDISPITVSDTFMTIGILHQELGKYNYALYSFYQAFNVRIEFYKDHKISDNEYLLLSDMLASIEFLHYTVGNYSDALELCKMRLESYESIYGYTSYIVADTMITVATLYDALEIYQDAYYYLHGAMYISNNIDNHEEKFLIEEMIHEIARKIEYSSNSQELNNNTLGASLSALGYYSVKDVAKDGNCFFRAAALSLDLPESLHSLLRERTVEHIRNNFVLFLEFSENLEFEISNLERDGEWVDNLSIQAFADAFQVNIELHTIQGDNLAIITSRTTDTDSRIILVYTGNHYMATFDSMIDHNAMLDQHSLSDLQSSLLNQSDQLCIHFNMEVMNGNVEDWFMGSIPSINEDGSI